MELIKYHAGNQSMLRFGSKVAYIWRSKFNLGVKKQI